MNCAIARNPTPFRGGSFTMINMKMETTGKRILISSTADGHMIRLPIGIVLGKYIHEYDMNFVKEEDGFFVYEFMPRNKALERIPKIADQDAFGIDTIKW